MLVGNKIDLGGSRKVTYKEGKELADNNGMLFFETSAKTGASVDSVFYQATSDIIKKNPDVVATSSAKKIELNYELKDKSQGGCC